MWRVMLLAIVIAPGTGAVAQQDSDELLPLVRARVAEVIDRLPNYLCTQTVDRTEYLPSVRDLSGQCNESDQRSTHLASSDRLRLDVGMGTASEMYSWAGEDRFDDRNLLDMVRDGAISTGSFGALLTAIFQVDHSVFRYDGETRWNGKQASQFGFRVPAGTSHYVYVEGSRRAVAGYFGTILVDRDTRDPLRLVVRTDRLPAETSACFANTSVTYARQTINGVEATLPSEYLLRIVHVDGSESGSRTVFSGCREFRGQSTITFDTPEAVTSSKARASGPETAIPKGLTFRVVTTQPIDAATAAAGDPVRAQLLTSLVDHRKVLAPKGAAVQARVARIRRYYGIDGRIEIDLRLESVQVGNSRLRIVADPQQMPRFPGPERGTLRRPIQLGSLRGLEEHAAAFVYRDVSAAFVLPAGVESGWVTR